MGPHSSIDWEDTCRVLCGHCDLRAREKVVVLVEDYSEPGDELNRSPAPGIDAKVLRLLEKKPNLLG